MASKQNQGTEPAGMVGFARRDPVSQNNALEKSECRETAHFCRQTLQLRSGGLHMVLFYPHPEHCFLLQHTSSHSISLRHVMDDVG